MWLSAQTRIVEGAKLVLNGPGVFFATDVISFRVTYALNSLPTAELLIPVGREFFSAGVSNAYALLSGAINARTPAFLFFNVHPGDTIPGKINVANVNTCIFAGFVHTIRESISGNDIVLQIVLRHWLSELTFSSTLSAMSHPSNPKDTIYNPLISDWTGGGAINYSPASLPSAAIDPRAASQDFWLYAIVPLLRFLSSIDRINTNVFMGPGNDTNDFAVKRALNAFGPSVLTLNAGTMGDNLPQICEAMIDHLWGFLDQKPDSGFFESHANLTFFDKLKELSTEFFFTIVPFPLFYRAVPFQLGLAYHWQPYSDRKVIITCDEIVQFHVQNEQMKIPIRGTGLYTGVRTYAGTQLDKPEEATQNYIGGWFVEVPDPGYGITQILQPPPYLHLPYEPSAYTIAAAGGVYAPISSMRNRLAVDKALRGQQAVLNKGRFNFLDYLAQFYHVQSKLLLRRATVVCPFRGDICPGSTIGIGLEDGSFVPAYIDSTYIYGTVVAVTYEANADQPPTTRYDLLGVRTVAEMNNINFSIPGHPVYANYFVGSPHLY